MSAIIETHTRGRYHVTETPAEVRRELRHSAELGCGATFTTTGGHVTAIHLREVRNVRRPHQHRPWARRVAATAALLLIVVPCYIAGTAAVSLGGYAFLGELFGHGSELGVAGWLVFPGFAVWWTGGAVGHWAMDTLGI